MSVSAEDFAAYADGELAGEAAARVAAAIAADPELAARLEGEQRLRAALKTALDPVLDEPVPESLTLMIAAFAADEAEQDMTDARAVEDSDAPETKPAASVLDIAAARRKRDVGTAPTRRMAWSGWANASAIAASLVLGLMLGTQWSGSDGPVSQKDGALVASGTLAQGLETRLAAAGAEPDGLHVLASFQRDGGDFCRVFEAGSTSGIACKQDGDWVLERTLATAPAQAADYRQAGSPQADLMAAAQAMANGEPLDAAQEKAAAANGWRK